MRYMNTLAAVVVMATSAVAAAQAPVLPVQGTLRAMAGNLVNDTRMVTFRLYNDDTGGTPFYEVEKTVIFTNGQFVAYLGDQEPIDATDFDGQPEVWLGIQVSPETVEMTPRVRLGTSPFALYAQMCGAAQTAEQADRATTADSATTATTASTANDLNCSRCVSEGHLNAAAFSAIAALYCALSLVTRHTDTDPSSGVSRYCLVVEQSPGTWSLCARGGRSQDVNPKTIVDCRMTCLSLQ